MTVKEISEIAKRFHIKLAQHGLADVKHIADMAADLTKHMNTLEGAAEEGGDMYDAIDNPQEAHKRMFRVRRILNTIQSVGRQMYKDATGPGMSEQVANEYVGHLNRLMQWLV